MLCNVSYGLIGALQDFWGLVLVSIVMFIIDVIYYRKWKKDEMCAIISISNEKERTK